MGQAFADDLDKVRTIKSIKGLDRVISNFWPTAAEDVPVCPENCTSKTCEWCWKDVHLANGLCYQTDTEFYMKYIYGPMINGPGKK